MNCLVINMFGGPGTGKSTTAAGLFHLMKLKGYNVELVTEYAKDKVWEKNTNVFENQFYLSAKQQYRIFNAAQHVDIVITDSPIVLGCVYGAEPLLQRVLYHEHDKYKNVNIMLERVKKYNPVGRHQTQEEALEKDRQIRGLTTQLRDHTFEVVANKSAPHEILTRLLEEGIIEEK